MNFNHLMSEYQRKLAKMRAKTPNKNVIGFPPATSAPWCRQYVNVSLYCRHCAPAARILFLTEREFKVQEKLKTSEVKREEKRV